MNVKRAMLENLFGGGWVQKVSVPTRQVEGLEQELRRQARWLATLVALMLCMSFGVMVLIGAARALMSGSSDADLWQLAQSPGAGLMPVLSLATTVAVAVFLATSVAPHAEPGVDGISDEEMARQIFVNQIGLLVCGAAGVVTFSAVLNGIRQGEPVLIIGMGFLAGVLCAALTSTYWVSHLVHIRQDERREEGLRRADESIAELRRRGREPGETRRWRRQLLVASFCGGTGAALVVAVLGAVELTFRRDWALPAILQGAICFLAIPYCLAAKMAFDCQMMVTASRRDALNILLPSGAALFLYLLVLPALLIGYNVRTGVAMLLTSAIAISYAYFLSRSEVASEEAMRRLWRWREATVVSGPRVKGDAATDSPGASAQSPRPLAVPNHRRSPEGISALTMLSTTAPTAQLTACAIPGRQ